MTIQGATTTSPTLSLTLNTQQSSGPVTKQAEAKAEKLAGVNDGDETTANLGASIDKLA